MERRLRCRHQSLFLKERHADWLETQQELVRLRERVAELEAHVRFLPINALIPPTLMAFRGRNQGYDEEGGRPMGEG